MAGFSPLRPLNKIKMTKQHLLAVALLSVFAISVNAQSVSENAYLTGTTACGDPYAIPIDYSRFTYSWTDSEGVTHTSDFTQEATSWPQMKALIKELITNKEVPGMIKDPTHPDLLPTNGRRIAEVKKDASGNVTSTGVTFDPVTVNYKQKFADWDIAQAADYTPTYEGMTAVLVKMKNDAGQASKNSPVKTLMEDNVESMQVITDVMRVDGDRCGWVFTAKANLNKFFIMTKGKLRTTSERPFGWMFEQFSPADDHLVPTRAYEYMLSSGEYVIRHDCKSPITAYHPTVMGDDGSSQGYNSSIILFVDDNRFAALQADQLDATETLNGYKYNNHGAYPRKVNVGEDWSRDDRTSFIYYSEKYTPSFLFNTVHLTDVGVSVPDDDSNRCKVQLKWKTAISNYLKGTDKNEVYTLFRVVDGVKVPVADISELESTDGDLTKFTADGDCISINHINGEMTVNVYEELTYNYRSMSYLVEARVQDSMLSPVESGVVTVVLPGSSIFERCTLTIAQRPKSYFIHENVDGASADRNHYTHSFSLLNQTNYPHPLRAHHLSLPSDDGKNHYFTLLRATAKEINSEMFMDWEEVSTLEITRIEQQADGYTYFYGVQRRNEEDSVERAWFRSNIEEGATAILEPLDDENGSNEWFVSEFEEYTADNSHPDAYYYQLQTNIPITDEEGNSGYLTSSVFRIDIPHSQVSMDFTAITPESITNDPEVEVTESPRELTYDVVDNAKAQTYALTFFNDKARSTGMEFAVAERAQDGTYSETVINENGEYGDLSSIDPSTRLHSLPQYITDNYSHGVTVITDDEGNTYGSGRAYIPQDVTLTAQIDWIYISEGQYRVRASWQPVISEASEEYLIHNQNFNLWLAPHNVAPDDAGDDVWAALNFEQALDFNTPATSISRRSESSEDSEDTDAGGKIDYAFANQPDWEIGEDADPLAVYGVVRYYPQLKSSSAEAPLYAMTEARFSSYSFLTPESLTGAETIDTHIPVKIYSLQGDLLRSYDAVASHALKIDLFGLPAGIYVARVGSQIIKVMNR